MVTTVEESLGDRIRQARERIRMPNGRRMTQGELAAAVEVERNTVSRWENGDVQPNKPAQLLRLAVEDDPAGRRPGGPGPPPRDT